jgi:hypothetical protein
MGPQGSSVVADNAAYGERMTGPDADADADATEQRAAVTAAQALRAQRARLVAQVAAGDLTLDGLLAEQDADGRTATVKIVVLAEKVPGVGKVRARRAMAGLGIPEDARWGEVDRITLRALWSAMAEAATHPISEPVTSD